ncbi:MAG: adenosylcobinamide-GDP ribazoletransferase [Thiolinea sp.]
MMKHFYIALSFLTRIPTPEPGQLEPVDFGRSALYYPLVGLLIGGLIYLPMWLLPQAAPQLLAAIMVVIWAAVTGGLHLDGLADSTDAWLGGFGDEEKTHRIMKDPLVGAAGGIAIGAVLLLKYAALSVVVEKQLWWAVLLAPVLGRVAVLMLFMSTPYVRAGGLAGAVTEFMPRRAVMAVVTLCLALGLWLSWYGVLWLLLVFWLLRRLMLQRLKGCTGDTAGAVVELSEVFWLLGVAVGLAASP